jgi:hypothetical protein
MPALVGATGPESFAGYDPGRVERLESVIRDVAAHLRHYGDIGASAAREMLEEALR